MVEKNLSEYKRRYDLSRHHAWAGLGFLSVLGFLRIMFVDLADLLQPILIILIIYVIISLLLTYRYHSGLSLKQENVTHIDDDKKDTIDAEVEKKRLKIEKKKVKASIKAGKKSKKK